MDVLSIIIQNTSINGMPKWYQILTLSMFAIITVTVISMYYLLVAHGADLTVRFSY